MELSVFYLWLSAFNFVMVLITTWDYDYLDSFQIGLSMALGGLDDGRTFHVEAARCVPQCQNMGLSTEVVLSMNEEFNARWPQWDDFKGTSTQTHFDDGIMDKIDMHIRRVCLNIWRDLTSQNHQLYNGVYEAGGIYSKCLIDYQWYAPSTISHYVVLMNIQCSKSYSICMIFSQSVNRYFMALIYIVIQVIYAVQYSKYIMDWQLNSHSKISSKINK